MRWTHVLLWCFLSVAGEVVCLVALGPMGAIAGAAVILWLVSYVTEDRAGEPSLEAPDSPVAPSPS